MKHIKYILIAVLLLTACTQDDFQTEKTTESTFLQTNNILQNITGLQPLKAEFTAEAQDIYNYFSIRDFENTYEIFENIDLSKKETDSENVRFSENSITITKEGIYKLYGECEDTQIVINCSKDEKVQLIFDNIAMKHSSNSIIHIAQADKVFITLEENSINTLDCYIKTLGTEDAVIFSREDLTINGKGTLNITGINANGITSKDDLRIVEGNFNIIADKYGLEANDYIKIADGNFYINSKDDAIRTKLNDDVAGHIYIKNGNFNITTLSDAIDSKGDILIENGNFNIITDKDGIRATRNLTINNGIFDVNVRKDAIGSYEKTVIYDGDFYISNCFEGIESQIIEIHGGNFLITSTDDGINCSYVDPLNKSGECYIKITNGNIIIDSIFEADGIDSNNDLFISGGNIIISSNIEEIYNTVIDYEGVGVITGGTLLATGNITSSNNQNFSENSTQCSIMVKLDDVEDGEISLLNEKNQEVLKITPPKAYQLVLLSSPEIKIGEKYTLITPNSSFDIFMDDYIYGKYDDPHPLDYEAEILKNADGDFMCEILEVHGDTAYVKVTDYLSGENFGEFSYITLNNFEVFEGQIARIYYNALQIQQIKELIVVGIE